MLKQWGVILHLFQGGIATWIRWNSSAWEICLFTPFIIYPIIYLNQYRFIHGHLFYILGYNPMLFSCSNYVSFGHWKHFHLTPESLWHVPIIVALFIFLRTTYFLALLRYSRLILCISCSSSRITHFSKKLLLLILEKGIRNQVLGAMGASCYCDVISFRPYQLTANTTSARWSRSLSTLKIMWILKYPWYGKNGTFPLWSSFPKLVTPV